MTIVLNDAAKIMKKNEFEPHMPYFFVFALFPNVYQRRLFVLNISEYKTFQPKNFVFQNNYISLHPR